MKLNIKGIFKSVVAGATIVGGAILGLEAKKCFTKPIAPDDECDDDLFCEDCEAVEETSAEEADDEPAEVPED
jgi:hypothetical protein